MSRFKLPNLPREYMVITLMVGLLILKVMKIDSWTDMALGTILGYLVGVKLEQIRWKK